MSALRHPDTRNVHDMYGHAVQRAAQRWVEDGELLGYQLREIQVWSLGFIAIDRLTEAGRLVVEVSRAQDQTTWYAKRTDKVSDLLDRVCDVFIEPPGEILVLAHTGPAEEHRGRVMLGPW